MNYNQLINEFCNLHKINRNQFLKPPNKRVEIALQCLINILIKDLKLPKSAAYQAIGIKFSCEVEDILQIDYSLSTYYREFHKTEARLNHKKLIITEQLPIYDNIVLNHANSPYWEGALKTRNNLKSRLAKINYQLNNLSRGLPLLGEKEELDSAITLPSYMNFN